MITYSHITRTDNSFIPTEFAIHFSKYEPIYINLNLVRSIDEIATEIRTHVKYLCDDTISEDEVCKAVDAIRDAYKSYNNIVRTEALIARAAELNRNGNVKANASFVASDDFFEIYKVTYTILADGYKGFIFVIYDNRNDEYASFPKGWERYWEFDDNKIVFSISHSGRIVIPRPADTICVSLNDGTTI